MAGAAFNALAVTRQLKARGFDSDQAEAITEAVRTGVTGGVATKADLADMETRLTWRIIVVIESVADLGYSVGERAQVLRKLVKGGFAACPGTLDKGVQPSPESGKVQAYGRDMNPFSDKRHVPALRLLCADLGQ